MWTRKNSKHGFVVIKHGNEKPMDGNCGTASGVKMRALL
jgi:hypothetical protein